MQTRPFGRTGHASTVAIFGAAAFWEIDQPHADRVMELVIRHGVNHIDVAPSYGQAEERLGPWLKRERDRFFVGCKTMERTKEGAAAELQRSLARLQTDHFDLYQIHAITTMEELDAVTAPGGALEALRDAREAGLTRFVGITGHGVDSPAIFLEALERFDFDSILFPLNFVQFANPVFRKDAEALLRKCRAGNVATMIIKSITKGPWGEHPKTHSTWYEPFMDAESIQPAVDFVLSQDVCGLCTAGDTTVLPLVLDACEHFQPMDAQAREQLVASADRFQPLFA
ncbi:MAG TPA: aldo/keto reductase [Anaerolineales bacterium]|nr:aldo/keto reductase [Anaerolineales bacterium]